jgi:hypothetical protein
VSEFRFIYLLTLYYWPFVSWCLLALSRQMYVFVFFQLGWRLHSCDCLVSHVASFRHRILYATTVTLPSQSFFCLLVCPRLAYNKGCVLLRFFFVCLWFWINIFPLLLFPLNWYSWALSHTLLSFGYSAIYYLQILVNFALLYVIIFLSYTNKASSSLEFSYYLNFLISRNSLFPHLRFSSHWYNKYYFWLCKGKGKAIPVQAS